MLVGILLALVMIGITAGSAMYAGTLTPDTTSVPINGKDGTADFTIDDGTTILSYKCILDMFSVREAIEMTNADTFCTEGASDQEPGRSQLVGSLSGVGKKDGPSSGPLMPAPQNVDVKLTYSTGCFITCKANFFDSTATRMVNQNMRISSGFLSKGAYAVTWDKSAA